MILYILLAIVAAIALLVVFIASRPSTFTVERSAFMNAPPERVFPEVNNFHQWEAWNPWGKLDPNMTTEYSGPDQGIGASYWWKGNGSVGEGRMTITGSVPAEYVKIKLEFIRPFTATNLTELKLTGQDGGTYVVWSMVGTNKFINKAFSLIIDMEKIIGDNYVKGLNDLKKIVETSEA